MDDDALFAPFTVEELAAAEKKVRDDQERIARQCAEADEDMKRMGKVMGAQLSAIVSERGITTAELAKRTEMPERTIKQILRGTFKNPSIWRLSIIAQAMDCQLVPKLVDRTEEPD